MSLYTVQTTEFIAMLTLVDFSSSVMLNSVHS